MKIVKLSIIAAMITLFGTIYYAAQTKIYLNVDVEKFSIKQGVDFPSDKIDDLTESLIKSLEGTKKFDKVTLSTPPNPNNPVQTTQAPTSPQLKISAEIIKYEKGSQAKRYIIGMGAGKTKIIANVKFTDVQSGKIIYEEVVDGIISWGLFGGDKNQAQNNLAKQIAKITKTKFVAGK